MNTNNIIASTQKGMETYQKLKENGTISYCCLSDDVIIELNMIIQLMKMDNLKGRITITLTGGKNE